jgi:GNAT superfamily N-acetyltransferase
MSAPRQGSPVSAAASLAPPRPQRFPSVLIDRLRLTDEREVVVRPVLAWDAAAEQDFVRALSPASRLKRFHFGLKELPPSMLRAMTEVDHEAHVAIVAEAFDADDEPTIVADARYVRSPGEDEAEFAIAVADDWQGIGLGRALMERLGRHAARQGVTHLVGDVLPGNAAMFAVTAALGGEQLASPNGPGVTRARFALAGCAPTSEGGIRTGEPAPGPSRPS